MSHSLHERPGFAARTTPKTTHQDHLVTASEVLGRKWQPVIVYTLLEHGPMGFAELDDRIGPISNKVLAENLADLEEAGLLNREVIKTEPFRVRYTLTEDGKALEPVLEEIVEWGQNHGEQLDTVPDGNDSRQNRSP